MDDIAIAIRNSIDAFINFEEHLGEESSVEEIGQFYLEYINGRDSEKYYYNQKFSFPGELTKKLIERVLIAAKNGYALEMEVIPSLLSIWSGEKVPGDYYTVITLKIIKSLLIMLKGFRRKTGGRNRNIFTDTNYNGGTP
ncbi:Imm47 family immunity protein [Paenibacillus sp. GCM10027627]|uniref:Imm47 family immunity protein n=1 Tax=Paenibacillus sp. GCM10027627 TaxID=3273412 RepID=UPI003633345E